MKDAKRLGFKTSAENDPPYISLLPRFRELAEQGLNNRAIADILNQEGPPTKRGEAWNKQHVLRILHLSDSPIKRGPSKTAKKKAARRRKSEASRQDSNFSWVAERYSDQDLDLWVLYARRWALSLETGLQAAIQGVNGLLDYLIASAIPRNPAEFLLRRSNVPNLYNVWFRKGQRKTSSNVSKNNCASAFVNWVLSQPEFCEEDDEGRLLTSPAFRNPVPFVSRKGIARPNESVRPTLPYGYIDELRKMIAEGPNFRDWKWAQSMMAQGRPSNRDVGHELSDSSGEEDDATYSTLWFEVPESQIDKSDPDCVWRKRTRQLSSRRENGLHVRETIFEMWSPVRWVALLLKLQLPLRTFQVRMLDSGEGDTWHWSEQKWELNSHPLAQGTEKSPYSNGVFKKPNQLSDGIADVLLHINTNKTADLDKEGTAKGYNVPWVIGGPLHQDPFYWLEKLRNWQEKYNPIKSLVDWKELEKKHMAMKTEVQLAAYPVTAFLFRLAESAHPHLPMPIAGLDRLWFLCLEKLEQRLGQRHETLPNGRAIRLVPPKEHRQNANGTFFSLHSLRVSLITSLAIDGSVPLAILQKIAGHSRLIMTLYYTKPGAIQSRNAIQAGLVLLNDSADDTILDWLATVEYEQLVKEVIANNPQAFMRAVPEQVHLRSPAGWMSMVDGLCLVGGNNVERDAPGCHDGGQNIGNDSAPRYAPVTGGARNCPMCRWFITRPYFLPQLAARWNNVTYHCYDARSQIVSAEARFRLLDDLRAEAIASDQIFPEQRQYKESERALQQAIQKFDELTQTLAAITRLIERCRERLNTGQGDELIAAGGVNEFEYAIEDVDSELLQVSGVCEGALLYPDLDPGKAVLRQGQLLDAALVRDSLPPLFLTLTEPEQHLVGNALMHEMARRMNPDNPNLGRYQVIRIVDARESLRARLGTALEQAIEDAMQEGAPRIVSARTPLKELALESAT